jgi:hypothetical protein
MFRILRPAFAVLPVLLSPLIASADDPTEAAGVNLSTEEGFGARHSGMAIDFAGFQRDANAVANAPAAMNDVDDFTFATAHAEKFGEAKYDDFAVLIPFEARSTMGLGIARYGVSNIEYHTVEHAFESQPEGLFSTADYLLVAGFSRRWGDPRSGVLDAGANLHLLYRQLDQDGFGTRADAQASYTWQGLYRVGAMVKGLIPSSAKWESGYVEYEAPDILIGAALKVPAPYFYGTLEAAYQTEGLLQKRAISRVKAVGSPDFIDILASGNLGAEFLFDFGLSVRFGFTELYLARDAAALSTFGIGYNWHGIAGLDYSFTPHPDLLASHRISVQFTPSFRKFNGRGFRAQRAPAAPPAGQSEEKAAPATPSASPNPGTPAPEKSAEPAPSPETPKTAPAGGNENRPAETAPEGKEILEQDE